MPSTGTTNVNSAAAARLEAMGITVAKPGRVDYGIEAVVAVEMHNKTVSDDVIRDVLSLFDNVHVVTYDCRFEANMRIAADTDRIRGLVVRGKATSFTSDDSRCLKRLTRLAFLEIANVPLRSSDLACLSPLNELRTVRLQGCSVPDDAPQWLAGKTNISELDLSNNPIGDRTMEQLVDSRAIVTLDLSGTNVTDKGMVHLGRFRDLRQLSLAKTVITDATIERLVGLDNIEAIDLSETKVSEECLQWLRKLPNLNVLILRNSRVNANIARRWLPKAVVTAE